MTYEIRRAKIMDYIDEVTGLVVEHWQDVRGMPGCPDLDIDLDLNAYAVLEKQNVIVNLGLFVKETDKLCGYISAVITPSYQHKDQLFAFTDGFFIQKEHRTSQSLYYISQMFKKMETILKDEYGVKYFSMRANTTNDLAPLAKRLGYEADCIEYIKRL